MRKNGIRRTNKRCMVKDRKEMTEEMRDKKKAGKGGIVRRLLAGAVLVGCLSALGPVEALAAKRPYAYGTSGEDEEAYGPALAGNAASTGTGIAGISGADGIAAASALDASTGSGPNQIVEDNAEAAAKRAALADNTLEFSEIAGRIENYNVSFRNTKSTTLGKLINQGVISELTEEARDLTKEADDLKEDEMDEEDKALYESYRLTAKELRKKAADIRHTETDSLETSLRQSRNSLIKMVQNQYIAYEKAKYSLNAARKSEAACENDLSAAQTKQSAGLALEADVLEARNKLLAAQKKTMSAESQLSGAKNKILISLGWDVDADVEITDIPAPDMSLIASIDLAADTQTAITSNYSLITTRKGSSKTTAAKTQKNRAVTASRTMITSSMNTLYAVVVSKQQAYDAAQDAWAKAQNDWNSAQIKYRGGLSGRSEYLSAEAAYENALASEKSAELDLISAMQTYDWAVAGLIANG